MEEGDLAVLANRVYARVSNNLTSSGIDIEAGKITLSSENTNAIGNFNITGDDSNFQAIDDKGNIRVRMGSFQMPTNVGDFVQGSQWFPVEFNIPDGMTSGESRELYLGNYSQGSHITVSGTTAPVSHKTPTSTHTYQPGTNVVFSVRPLVYLRIGDVGNYSYELKYTGSQQSADLLSTSELSQALCGFTTDAPTTGDYVVKYEFAYSGPSETGGRVYINFNCYLTGKKMLAKTVIGRNGFACSNNLNSYFYTGVHGTVMTNGGGIGLVVDGGVHAVKGILNLKANDRLPIHPSLMIVP